MKNILKDILQCINCENKNLKKNFINYYCDKCHKNYDLVNNAINFISDYDAETFRLKKTQNISSNSYNNSLMSLINEVIKKDGLILDCGSGKRNFIHKNLIQSEVVPYDNVDVLASNQKLPFINNSFDLIISLDVLEHVTDPIKSSSELSRCLKNGGLLLVDIPFLQAEHGYPDHYFNASRSGMKILFKELKSIIHLVPPSGHPFHVIWSILRTYKNSYLQI